MVSVTAPPDSKRAGKIRKRRVLPPGAYLAKVYPDRGQNLAKNPDYKFKKSKFLGQVEITGKWTIGRRKS